MPLPRPAMPRRPGRPAPSAVMFALLALVALVAGACVPTAVQPSPTATLAPTTKPSPNPYTGATAGSGAGVKIGYVSAGDSVPFIKAVSDGIAAQATAAGATLVPCDSNLDSGTLMSCLKQLGDAGVKGMIVFSLGTKTAADICGGIAAGVPVVAIEYGLDPCSKTTLAADDLRAGQIAGRAAGQWVGANWPAPSASPTSAASAQPSASPTSAASAQPSASPTSAASAQPSASPTSAASAQPSASPTSAVECGIDALVGLQSSSAQVRSDLRTTGFRQGFVETCKDNAFQNGLADTASVAASAMEGFLGSNAGKHILVFGVNDDAITGTLQAATSTGRTANVWVVGQGAFDPAVRAQIRSNPQYLGDSAYFPERYGTSAVPALLDLIAGKTVPSTLLIEPTWLDKTTIASVYPN